jgi:8-oxo-dGTP pyrophosphatase MutT (NUDIX family)
MVKRIAWGCVARNVGNGLEFLVAERCKEGDPLRKGELVFPGGSLKIRENYTQAAMREVKGETGIETVIEPLLPNGIESFVDGSQFEVQNSKVKASVELDGKVRINYLDSKKSYVGRFVSLDPKDPHKEPSTQAGSDARNPKYVPYVSLSLILRRKLTPASQVLLSMLEPAYEGEHRMSSFRRF